MTKLADGWVDISRLDGWADPRQVSLTASSVKSELYLVSADC